MNKDKLIEAKKIVMHEIGQALESATKQEINFSMQMAIAGILGDLTATLDDKLDDIIQSEPEETCEGCKHERKAGDEYPCSNCKRCWCDKYEKAGE